MLLSWQHGREDGGIAAWLDLNTITSNEQRLSQGKQEGAEFTAECFWAGTLGPKPEP